MSAIAVPVKGSAQSVQGWKRPIMLAMAMVLLVSIGDAGAPGPISPLPINAVPFTPPAAYRLWWARTEACSARRGDLSAIEWFVVPQVSTFGTTEGAKVARWSHGEGGARVVIAGAFVNDEMVVRHEMLHALLDQGGHPAEYFVGRCHLTWQSWGG